MTKSQPQSLPPPTASESAARASAIFMIVLRVLFVVSLIAVGWGLTKDERYSTGTRAGNRDVIVLACAAAALLVIALDVLIPRKSLSAISGLFFGLVVGMVVAYGMSLIVGLVVEANSPGEEMSDLTESILSAVQLGIGVVCCYLSVSFIQQTKDDFRFVIPYVEFAKDAKGARPLILDTSVVVDGRIADVADTRIIDSELIVPRFVLQELQTIADSGDKLKRIRGRRGLDMLNRLQSNDKIDIRVLDVVPERSAANAGVDEMLLDLALQLNGRLVTTDYNLNKIAQLRGAPVININDLANALKPVVLPGEGLSVKMVKPGEEPGQGIGYLEDGTMVVVEGGRDRIGQVVELSVTSVLQTSAGRMVFGRTNATNVTPGRASS